jgi:GxxExxY protein
MEEDIITSEIIGAAIEVHKILGNGLLETVYEEALCHEFDLRNINYERQKEVPVIYKNKKIKGQRLDILVENEVVVELKALRKNHNHAISQVLSYLKATGIKKGLLLNFGKEKLIDGIKRIVL